LDMAEKFVERKEWGRDAMKLPNGESNDFDKV